MSFFKANILQQKNKPFHINKFVFGKHFVFNIFSVINKTDPYIKRLKKVTQLDFLITGAHTSLKCHKFLTCSSTEQKVLASISTSK